MQVDLGIEDSWAQRHTWYHHYHLVRAVTAVAADWVLADDDADDG